MTEPKSVQEIAAALEAVATENFSAALGQLVRAIDIWEDRSAILQAPKPPGWALEARDAVIRHIEWLAEQQ